MELLLVRHALPERVEGDAPADPGLSEVGRHQAEALAAWLADEPVDAIYSSPMRRARETAVPLAAAHGVGVAVDDELAEFDQGAHWYIPLEELKANNDPRYQAVVEGRWGPGGEIGERDPETFRAGVVKASNGSSPPTRRPGGDRRPRRRERRLPLLDPRDRAPALLHFGLHRDQPGHGFQHWHQDAPLPQRVVPPPLRTRRGSNPSLSAAPATSGGLSRGGPSS